MQSIEKVYILIVDDSPENQLVLKACLEELDQHLIFASSAKEALRYVLQYDFAVILLDVNMPVINGFEAAQLIRSRDKSSYTPIIFITALNKDETDVDQGYAMGAVDYIFKPINPVILRSKVKVFVDLFTKSTLAINLQNELKRREAAEQQASKRKRQLEVAEMDRVSSMEEMGSALAHELNQPLTSIANYTKGCINRLKKGDYQLEKLLEVLQRTCQQAERAGAILHRIKNFVKKNKLYFEPVSINELIMNTLSFIHDSAEQDAVEIAVDLDKRISSSILLDKIQIEQVILNLLRNGVEALQTCTYERKLKIRSILCDKIIRIEIQDNGPGINSKHLETIFDLYFSTKKSGMGIGLSICRTIIEAHHGNITASNNHDGGALFQITLPMVTL